jgi:hypothetical protein
MHADAHADGDNNKTTRRVAARILTCTSQFYRAIQSMSISDGCDQLGGKWLHIARVPAAENQAICLNDHSHGLSRSRFTLYSPDSRRHDHLQLLLLAACQARVVHPHKIPGKDSSQREHIDGAENRSADSTPDNARNVSKSVLWSSHSVAATKRKVPACHTNEIRDLAAQASSFSFRIALLNPRANSETRC